MGHALQDMTLVAVGRGSRIARAVTLQARSEGARVIVAGRDKAKLADAYDDTDITAEVVDVTDDTSIAALADRVGPVDHNGVDRIGPRGKACRAGTQESAGVVRHEGSSAPPCWPNTLARI